MTQTLSLPSGSIRYQDTGGSGPVVVLCHGLLMDATVWDLASPHLHDELRLIRPTFPVGAHAIAMDDGADLSVKGQSRILGDLLDALDVRDVTLVVSDLGYPLRLVTDHNPRISKLVLLPTELYDNMPPGMPGKTIGAAGRIPGGLFLSIQTLRVPGAAKLPFTFGRLAKNTPTPMLKGWIDSARKRATRRDLRKYVRADDFDDISEISIALENCPLPTMIIWARTDKVMPFRGAERLAHAMPNAEMHALDEGTVLLQLDEPQWVGQLISTFARRP